LPSDDPEERSLMANDVVFRILTINDSFKDADDMIADVSSTEEVFKSLITKN
jgi:hypothetical protein